MKRTTDMATLALPLPSPAQRSNGGSDTLTLVAVLCVAQVVLWGSAFALTYSAPEIDSAEQFVWAFSLENGYWKHPPMPSWIMHALLAVFGPSVALPFIATQASIVIALALTWRLGCEWMSPRRSLIAMALTSLVTYHNLGGDAFNHNTAMLPFQAATVLLFYRATRTGQWHLWALAGLAAGLSMLVKYVALFPLASLVLYFLMDRQLHCRRQWAGFLLASLVACTVLVPHVLWLQSTSFLPFKYARSVAQALPGWSGTLATVGSFAMMQCVRVLPFVLALGFVFATRRTFGHNRFDGNGDGNGDGNVMRASPAALPCPGAQRPLDPSARLFLWIVATGPLLAPVLFGVLTQTELESRWGANAFLLTGWLVLALWQRADDALSLKRTLWCVCSAHVVLCLGMTLSKTVLADHFHVQTRANFPGAVLAQEAQKTWRAYTAVPLRLVVSDIWLGGNIVANSHQHIAVLIDGHRFKSPWVRESTVADCGALVLDDLTDDAAGHAAANPAIDALMSRASVVGTWSLPWAHADATEPRGSQGMVRWGIVLPTSAHGCSLGQQ